MMYQCQECQRPIPIEVASWSNQEYGRFYCPDCASKRQTIAQRIAEKQAKRRRDRFPEYPGLRELVDHAVDRQQSAERAQ